MRERVLVVDDDSQMLKAVTNALSARGYEVLKAGNGETALSLAAEEDLDLVLLDLGLPGIEGHEVIGRLRAWSDLPVIIISVRDSQEEKVAALDAGADDFITKPFGMKELLARMRAVRRRVADEGEPESVLRFDGLEIHLLKKLVKLEDKPVHLTPTEYRLLEAMATNPENFLRIRGSFRRFGDPDTGLNRTTCVSSFGNSVGSSPIRRPRPVGLRPSQGWATGGCLSPAAEAENTAPVRPRYRPTRLNGGRNGPSHGLPKRLGLVP